MELLKIVGGLGAIAVIIVLVGMSKGDSGSGAAPDRPAERGFASNTSTARFVAPPGE